MNASQKGKANRCNKKQVPAKSDSAQKEERKEPFALVLYEKGKEKGVVETKSIPKKNRVVGNTCNVPDPIDWCLEEGVKSTDKVHKATVVTFGCKYYPVILDLLSFN